MSDERTQRERMLAGELYLADDPELIAQNNWAMQLARSYDSIDVADTDAQRALLSELLGSFGEESVIRAPFRCDYGFNVHIGTGTFANFGLVALDVAEIRIGDDVQMGPNVQLLTPTHPVEPVARRAKWEAAEPITIHDNVWLGGGAIVLAGVTIGEDTVVGAGSVVTRNLPPGVVAVGNPARAIRSVS